MFIQGPAKYLTILQNSCEWNRWHGEFVLECPSSETQSISVAMEHWLPNSGDISRATWTKRNQGQRWA